MELELKFQQSDFSEFSDNLWMLATNGESTIKFDVYQPELLDFALHLIDIADVCLHKRLDKIGQEDVYGARMDIYGARIKLREAFDAINSINAKQEKK